jgi:hypothetical protein
LLDVGGLTGATVDGCVISLFFLHALKLIIKIAANQNIFFIFKLFSLITKPYFFRSIAHYGRSFKARLFVDTLRLNYSS